METYNVSKEMQAEAERMVIALSIGGSVEMFEEFANQLADKYAPNSDEAERGKIKEYLRRKTLNSKIEDGSIVLGDAAEPIVPKVISENPDEITPSKLDCVVMPNGEVISCGKVLGRVGEFEGMLTTKV